MVAIIWSKDVTVFILLTSHLDLGVAYFWDCIH